MSKMAILFEDKKTAKRQHVIYFTAKPNEPPQPKTKAKQLTKKVFKKLEKLNGGGNGPRKDRLEKMYHRRSAEGGIGSKISRLEITSLWKKSRVDTTRSVLGPRNRCGVLIRGDLHGRYAVSVKTSRKTRQKVSNLASKSRQKLSYLASGQKVSNPMEREQEQGESVGRGVAPRPCIPDARSSPRLLRESNKPS
jgi:hypothetical protein